ncbi:MAG TPA: hypothetical protein VL866_24185 [Pyrinomonadaceae bacterium]|nr:hypothetical protein [Pyrinomonadaceae bacterium]
MSDEYDRERFTRYIKASKMLEEIVTMTADAEPGYWGHWVPFQEGVKMLVRARNSGSLDLIAATGNAICESAERARRKLPPRRSRSPSNE